VRIADRYDAFLFDLDGVLFREAEPIPGAAEVLAELRAAGRGLAFVTNNSSRPPAEVGAHLRALGIAADPTEVVTSAQATGELLAEQGVGTAYVLGEAGLRVALAEAGVGIVDGEPERVDAVVVGLDRAVTYERLRIAGELVQRGARLVASNADASFPAPGGVTWPGAGAIVAAIETATGVRAEVVGKPHAPLFRMALGRAGGVRPLVVGDRLDTDVAGAAALGWDAALVLTGVTTAEEAARADPPATYVLEDLRGLLLDPGA
jgi:HAD superfamily hydrolase (TIGR01450 family)